MSRPSSLTPPDTSRCPLCGANNQCAVSAGSPAQDCWCMTATVSPSALAQLPDSARVQSCLCPACAAGPAPSIPATPAA